MSWWLFVKQFPKYALVLGVIIGSTVLFAFWWFTHSRAKPRPFHDTAVDQAAIQMQAAKAEARIGYLFLADSDLYDAGTGELLIKNWLKGDAPLRLFYDPTAKRLYGQFARGFARYAFDGTREATMMGIDTLTFFDGFKKVVFAKSKNVWVADADWQNFRFGNERQVTTIDSFYEQHFAENIRLLTSKTLIVRNLNNLLRVNLENGSVKPTRIPLGDIGKRRSPDSKWVVGVLNGQFYGYDVDADDAKTIPIGRTGISDFQWLGNDKCLGLAGRQEVVVYDRLAHSLTAVTTLPFACFKIGESSPDGRFVFAAGGLNGSMGALVDLEKKTAAKVNGGAGISWVSTDTFAYSREVPDSDLRGTWLQIAGEGETKISPEPYLVSNGRPQLMTLPSAGLVILETKYGLAKMKPDGSEFTRLINLPRPASQVLGINRWEQGGVIPLSP